MIHGCATAAGTARYAERFSDLASSGHFRPIQGSGALPPFLMSSLGIGTYLGEADDATDHSYVEALLAALESGINVIDTAINYRHQRSERNVGEVLRSGKCRRDEIVLCTKAGYMPFDGNVPPEPAAYLIDTYVRTELAPQRQIAQGPHCIAPQYLADQLQRSRRNLGVNTIDVFYLHNPEAQAAELPASEFMARVRAACEFLEKAVRDEQVQFYGMATWNGLRIRPDQPGFLDLPKIVEVAQQVGGPNHRFRFVQVPYNLAMPEAYVTANQTVDGETVPIIEAARRLGINVVASASLASGRLNGLAPAAVAYLRSFFAGSETPAEMALQFVRSTPGVITALAGMSKRAHVNINLRASRFPPAPTAAIQQILTRH